MDEFIGVVVFGLIGIAVAAFLVMVFGMLFTGPAMVVKIASEEVHRHRHHEAPGPGGGGPLARRHRHREPQPDAVRGESRLAA